MSFSSWNDFRLFSDQVKNCSRYFLPDKSANFLNAVKASLCTREVTLEKGIILYRSQFGYARYPLEDYEAIEGHPRERMIPTSKYAKEGRVNPKGIPYLYLSSDKDTSMSEMRAHVGEFLSCADFKVVNNLRIVDCHRTDKVFDLVPTIFNPPTSQYDISITVWSTINDAFSLPVRNSDTSNDYIPTQILAELFRTEGFDGICYKSSTAQGLNYALFNVHAAEFIKSSIMKCSAIFYQFNEETPGLFI